MGIQKKTGQYKRKKIHPYNKMMEPIRKTQNKQCKHGQNGSSKNSRPHRKNSTRKRTHNRKTMGANWEKQKQQKQQRNNTNHTQKE